MKPAPLVELKKELKTLDANKLMEICLRLGRFKKENKELLTYILLEADDEEAYIRNLKSELNEMMTTVHTSHSYYAKKGLRKMIRFIDRFVKYSGKVETEVQVRIHFCQLVKDARLPIHRSKVLTNLYDRQLIKIGKKLEKLHADLQYDYKATIEDLK